MRPRYCLFFFGDFLFQPLIPEGEPFPGFLLIRLFPSCNPIGLEEGKNTFKFEGEKTIKGKYNNKWAAVEIVLQDTDNKVKNSIMNLHLP